MTLRSGAIERAAIMRASLRIRISMPSSRQVAVQLAHVGLRLAGRRVLHDIGWRIEPGQRWVLLGANGAGKTLLLKLLAGDVWPTPSPRALRRYTWAGQRFDEPAGVKEHIAYLGAERQDRYQHYEWNHRVRAIVGTGLYRSDIPLDQLTAVDRERVQRLLKSLGIEQLASRRFLQLSYGQRRLVLLARALAWRPGLLLMDELLNGLDQDNRLLALEVIHRISRRKLPWVLTTHRAADIPPEATHLAVIENGGIVSAGPLSAARRRRLQAAPSAGARIRPATRARLPRAARRTLASDEPLLSLRNAWVWLDGRAVLRKLAFDILPHQCWVVHGPNGSGKSTLIRALYGDLGVASQGQLRRRGIEAGIPISEFKSRVGLIAPELQTTHPLYLTAEEVVVSGHHSSIGLDEQPTAAERRRARAALAQVGAAALAGRKLRTLSYGQARRVLFARALLMCPDILLLDEPYTGLDMITRHKLQQRIDAAVAAGTTVVLTTHHRDEWPSATTHELQLREGAAVYCGPRRPPVRR